MLSNKLFICTFNIFILNVYLQHAPKFSTPIPNHVGLLFEHVHGLRRLTIDRFVFVQRFDFMPLLQELAIMQAELLEFNNIDCTQVKKFNAQKVLSLKTRIENQIKLIVPINNEYVIYNANDVNYDFDSLTEVFVDYETKILTFPFKTKWNEMSAEEARTIIQVSLQNFSNSLVELTMFLPTFNSSIVNEHEEQHNFKEFTKKNKCSFLAEITASAANKMKKGFEKAKILEKIIKQWHRNKLNISNTVLDDDILMKHMKSRIQILQRRQRAWPVDFNRPINETSFDLSETYKLHLFVEKNNSVYLFVSMPLLELTKYNLKPALFNVYSVTTVPYCKKKICLLMVPDYELLAISDSANFYFSLNNDYNNNCTFFASYNEYLCDSNNFIILNTINSRRCEVEMYMGRFDKIDTICNIKIASFDSKKNYVYPLTSSNKLMYVNFQNTSVKYLCEHYEGSYTFLPGVNVLQLDSCILKIDTNEYVLNYNLPTSTTYWPLQIFNYENRLAQHVDWQNNLLPKIYNFTRSKLLKWRNKFKIVHDRDIDYFFITNTKNDYNNVNVNTSFNKTYVIILISLSILFFGFCVLCCCYINKIKKRSKSSLIDVKYKNSQLTVSFNRNGNLMYFSDVNDNTNKEKTSSNMYPLLIKQIET